ncbi:MAG: hypothetical protein H7296_13205 [Bacteroidia bacterium]|nr:hypothetical protein [Bacteroidia bacterium]
MITSVGFGMDFSHRVIFKPTNYYGTIPAIERSIDIASPFINLGILIDYIPKKNSKLSYLLGINFSDDHFFNSNRYNDFGGYFRQDRIPLSSTILNTFVALKFNL